MESVAFFRNMNLGHPGSPDRETLVQAFSDAGALSARSFQTNGTVIFTAENPGDTAERARRFLADRYHDAVFVRSAARVAQLVTEFPATDTESDHYREMVVLYDASPEAPREPDAFQHGLVRVLRMDDDAAFGLVWKPKNTVGNVTALIERLLSTAGTARTLGTLQRLSRQLTPDA